jgi:hypothetical protein
VNVPVFDERPTEEREDTLPPEIDEDVAQAMLDELLFEQYGGRVAVEDANDDATEDPPEAENEDEDESGATHGGVQQIEPIESETDEEDGTQKGVAGCVDSYSVPAFDLARRHLGVVDTWANKVCRAAKNGAEFDLEILRRDGELLSAAFKRQAVRDGKKTSACSIGAKLAAEELTLRLKHFPEE